MIGRLMIVAGWAGLIFSGLIMVAKVGVASGRPSLVPLPHQLGIMFGAWIQATEIMLALSLLMLALGRMIELLERR